jgi:hypothetical protein
MIDDAILSIIKINSIDSLHRKTQIRAYTTVVRRQRLRISVENLAEGRRVELVEKTSHLDAILR